MQMQRVDVEEELRRTKEQLGLAEEGRDRALDELQGMKVLAQEANMRLSEALSSRKVREVTSELNSVKESLSNTKQELKIKETNLESLNLELDRANKQFEVKLAEWDSSLDRVNEELINVKLSESHAMRLLSESKERIKELEAEMERRKLSEAKMHETVASHTKQLKENKVELEESKIENVSLCEKMEKLKVLSRQNSGVLDVSQKYDNIDSMKEAFESLKSELKLAEEKLASAQEGEKVALSKAKSLLDEMNSLKNELKLAIEAEEKGKKALDDLALALKEVATESNRTKEKLGATRVELEHVKGEAEQLKTMVRSTEEMYQKLLDETKKESELNKNTVERLRLEAEESLLAWNDKEMGFVSCIKRAEEEKTHAQQENIRLTESLKASENMTKASRKEVQKIRDILKQAINEANIAKEAAGIARGENSQLKDYLADKNQALDLLTQENENLRINEAAAHESIKELKQLLSAASTKVSKAKDEEEGWIFKSPNSMAKEQQENERIYKTISFDLHNLKLQNNHDEDSELEMDYGNPEKVEALKGSIFDTADSPKMDHNTRKSSGHQRRGSSFMDYGETTNSEDFDHLDGTHFDDADGDKHSQRKRKALLRRFGDLLVRKSIHKKEPLSLE
ncbi:putative WEB family protein At1g65010, chloroplastic [Cornus florida]|uniref:putative WEB family protein At1g65010, chloroplastic n=1 Tax=Cornus florida TaxID=4283 RepID=UPI0028998B65|nr:putative WEB family protein At1g65010, chloroplastic [Cornus florida]